MSSSKNPRSFHPLTEEFFSRAGKPGGWLEAEFPTQASAEKFRQNCYYYRRAREREIESKESVSHLLGQDESLASDRVWLNQALLVELKIRKEAGIWKVLAESKWDGMDTDAFLSAFSEQDSREEQLQSPEQFPLQFPEQDPVRGLPRLDQGPEPFPEPEPEPVTVPAPEMDMDDLIQNMYFNQEKKEKQP